MSLYNAIRPERKEFITNVQTETKEDKPQIIQNAFLQMDQTKKYTFQITNHVVSQLKNIATSKENCTPYVEVQS